MQRRIFLVAGPSALDDLTLNCVPCWWPTLSYYIYISELFLFSP